MNVNAFSMLYVYSKYFVDLKHDFQCRQNLSKTIYVCFYISHMEYMICLETVSALLLKIKRISRFGHEISRTTWMILMKFDMYIQRYNRN